jgi:CO/xanthine dehydrogenase Mo-binding subunit
MARKRGRGMAACWYGIARTAVIDRAAAWAELDDGGSAKIVTGVTEIGEGILTVLAQIAAHEMGVKPEHVVIGDNDTARAPEASHAGASRQTYMIGNAVALASREARRRLVEVVADAWGVEADTIRTGNGEIWVEHTNHRMPMGEAVHLSKSRGVVPVGSASFATDTTASISSTAQADPGNPMYSVPRSPRSKSTL